MENRTPSAEVAGQPDVEHPPTCSDHENHCAPGLTSESDVGAARPLISAEFLTDRQHHAIDLLVTGVPRVLIARTIKISRSTLYNWLGAPAFVTELNRRRAMVREDLFDESVAMLRLAVNVVATELQNGDTAIALKALRLVSMQETIRPPAGPTTLDQYVDRQADASAAAAERSLRDELAMRPTSSIMDELGVGRDAIRVEAVESVRRHVEADLAAEIEESDTTEYIDDPADPPENAELAQPEPTSKPPAIAKPIAGVMNGEAQSFATERLFPLESVTSVVPGTRRNGTPARPS